MKTSIRTLGVAVIAAIALGAVIGPYSFAGGYGGGGTKTPTPGGGYGGSTLTLLLSAKTQKYSDVKQRGIKVTAAVPRPSTVSLKAFRNGTKIGSGSGSITGSGKVTVKLTSAGKKALTGAKTKVKVKGHAVAANGTKSATTAITVILKKKL